MDPGGSQGLLKLCESNNVDVDELHYLVTLSGTTGLVTHHFTHDSGKI